MYRGKEYRTLNEIKEIVENEIGVKIIDKFDDFVPRKNYLKVLEVLAHPENRVTLTRLLNVTYHVDPDVFPSDEERNILDL